VKIVFGILAVLVIPAAITLSTVRLPLQRSDVEMNPTPLGYTVSLLIYLVPVLTLHQWFSRRFVDRLDYRRRAFRRTVATLIPLGFALDVVLGYALLTFDNPAATLGIRLPALSFADFSFPLHLPVEEFVFYALGFIAILAVYVWCDEYWLKLYNVPDYDIPPGTTGRGLPLLLAQLQIRIPLTISAALVGAAWMYKAFGPHEYHDGFPTYFTFLVLASLLPSMLLFESTRRFINWQAFCFTLLWVLLTSLLWEATLAAPYQWWGYQEWHMLGLFVGAWFDLPIEAVLVWLAVTFTTVMVYEAFKILLSLKRVCGMEWRAALYGGDFRAWARSQLRPTS
jgi:hypothetical protein